MPVLQLKIVAILLEAVYNDSVRRICYGTKRQIDPALKSKPKVFTFDDAETLLRYFDYFRSNKGKTSGSRVTFINEQHGSILLHKPHPQKELKGYQIKQLIEILEQKGLI